MLPSPLLLCLAPAALSNSVIAKGRQGNVDRGSSTAGLTGEMVRPTENRRLWGSASAGRGVEVQVPVGALGSHSRTLTRSGRPSAQPVFRFRSYFSEVCPAL